VTLPFSSEGAAGLDVPLMVFDGGKLKTLRNLSNSHTTLHILFVGENQQTSFFQILIKRKEEVESRSHDTKERTRQSQYNLGVGDMTNILYHDTSHFISR